MCIFWQNRLQYSKLHFNVDAAPPTKWDLEIIVTKAIDPVGTFLFAPVDTNENADTYEDQPVDPVSVYAE